MEQEIVLRLNHYQAANLRWLLQVAWNCPCDRYPSLNTGDWVGEIPQMLEQEMIEVNCDYPANVKDEFSQKPLMGMYGGKKKADYETEKARIILDRVQKLVALKSLSDADKSRLVSEAAKGWWGLEHARALERG